MKSPSGSKPSTRSWTASFRIILGNKAKGINFFQTYRITLSSFALNYVTPFASLGGEAYRVLAIQDKVGTRDAVSKVLLFRMVYSTAHFFFWIISIMMIAFFLPLPPQMKIYLSIIFLVIAGLIYLFFSAQKYGIFKALYKLISFIPFLRGLKARLQRRQEAMLDIDSKIRELYNFRKGAFYGALFLEVLSRFTSSFEFYFILRAIGHEIPIIEAFYISAASSLLLNIFFFMPFELGTREGSLYLIMHSLNFTPGLGIYISLVNRIREFFWILIGLVLVRFTGGSAKGQKPELISVEKAI